MLPSVWKALSACETTGKNIIIISVDTVSSYPLTPTLNTQGYGKATVMTTLSQSQSSWVYKKIQEKQAAVVQRTQSSGPRGYEEQFPQPPQTPMVTP